MDEQNWSRLAELVRERRSTLGLSVRAAAAKASINRATWTAVELQETRLSRHLWAAVEQALRWSPGSIERILEGHPPATPPVDVVRPPAKIDLDYELDRVRALDIPPRTKLRLIQALIELAGQAQEAESGAPNATR